MIPFVILTDTRGQKISVNPEIVFGKDQLLRVRGTLDEVTGILRAG
jgi:hypothetical protein